MRPLDEVIGNCAFFEPWVSGSIVVSIEQDISQKESF